MPPRALALGLGEEPAPGWAPLAAGLGVDAAPQSGPVAAPHEAGLFEAVGRTREFPSPPFWRDPSDGLLFLFALHGFGELAAYARGAASAEGDRFWSAVVEDWLDACSEPSTPAWHPYPTSGRIVSWCAALSRGGWDDALGRRMTASLWRQARFLARSVEHDIGGNHVLRNAVALTVAGACLRAPALQGRGLRLLQSELGAQLLADGGHEERSPSYHREILDQLRDVRTLLERAGERPGPWLESAIEAMDGWLAAIAGPDGRLPLLNDAWEGPALRRTSEAPVRDLTGTGYVVLRHGRDQAVLDVAPVAPRHLPAHAHADALSCVVWADEAPVVVDPGSYSYGPGEERDAFRGTAAHNTVEVDGADQCDLWGPFRAAGLPAVTRLRTDLRDDGVAIVVAEHDGYRRLPDPVVHRRAFCWLPGEGLVVVDRIDARRAHAVRSSLHLAPGTTLGAGGRVGPFHLHTLGGLGPARAEEGRYAPFLGRAVPIEVLRLEGEVGPGQAFGWALLRGRAAVSARGDGFRVELPGSPAVEL